MSAARPSVLAFATTNEHKVREARGILGALGIEVVRAQGLPPVEEDGETFEANAILKAASAARHMGIAALAEDSGLVVPLLGGEPGVRSARYAGPDASDAANNALLVRRLVEAGASDPQAAFVCSAVVVAPDGTVLARGEGRVAGTIRWPARGAGGFGYDPLFHHPRSGRRFAELADEEKAAVSHRGRALRALVDAWRGAK